MTEREKYPYGLWPSPITPELLAESRQFEDVKWSRDGSHLVWLEDRGGRNTLVGLRIDDLDDLAPTDLSGDHDVRGRVGYGGGGFALSEDAVVHCERGGILRQVPLGSGEAATLTPPFGEVAAPAISPDGQLVLYVHHGAGEDALALVDVAHQRWPQRLKRGADFYMQPAWHPDGERVAWIEWDQPNMPWDGARLCLAELSLVGGVCVEQNTRVIAGGPETSVFQPTFSPDGKSLAFASDASGFAELYLVDLASQQSRQLTERGADLDAPAWVQGLRTFAFSPDSQRIYALESKDGRRRLLAVAVDSGEAEPVSGLDDYTYLAQPDVGRGSDGQDRVALLAAAPQVPPRVIVWEQGPVVREQGPEPPPQGASVRVIHRFTGERIPKAALAPAEAVSWVASDGETVHGLLYRPQSVRFSAAEEGPGPAIVSVHGGPTAQAMMTHDLRAQFFTSRGFAYLDVNYRGSSGFGRAYRRALDGRWGVLDVEDVMGGRQFLVDSGVAAARRLVVLGGSAGGYTVLRVLTQHPRAFAAGICLYGISNLLTLAAETHKFEARYLDRLIGVLPADVERYRERSPLFSADRIRDPLAIFQGSEDTAVPQNQAEAIVASLRSRGVPHAYHLYEGEGHGWRRPETIRRHWHDIERFLREHVLFG